ncbi:YybS family protein [Calidifontibacillus oryziterrae]|uniref:YybS family protein n=1 Tax=Calidifontibacillus oryziterrae TaxID=1191699 RepID=UPI0002DFFFF7|nr:DUF2232 domain-containing protein [Calidifontibacillus oryziterrae]
MNPIRSITEGAILAALYSIFLLAVFYLPILGTLFMFILSIPFLIYVVRHSIKKGFLLLIAALFITYIIGSVMALPLTLMFASTGMVMGYIYSLKKSSFAILAGGSLSFLINFVLLFIITIVFFNINFIEDTKKMMYQSIEAAEKMVTALGQTTTDQFKLMYESVELISYIVPSGMVMVSVGLAFITQLVGNQILNRIHFSVHPFPPIREWHFPKSMLWYYLIVMILYMIGVEQGTILFTIVINFLIVLEIIMTIQGFSFVFFYSHRNNYSSAIPVIILVVSLLLPFLLSIIRILGIIDLGFDLRKRMKRS